MSSIFTSNEMFINIKNPPRWNPKKSFWDQDLETIDFYLNEKRKFTEGFTINGYFVHPWLYWHMNFFKTPVPTKLSTGEKKEILRSPDLDDNFLYLIDCYKEAEEKNLGLMLFGTRGFGKSLSLSSLITWLNTTKNNGVTSITGGSTPDLKSLGTLMQLGFTNVHPAFKLGILSADWEKSVEFGIKEDAQSKLFHSRISIVNADPSKKSSTEKGAGLSPIGYVLDEALHEDSLIPTPKGLVPIKQLDEGDFVFDEEGNPTRIYNKINPGVQPTYKFTFSDGSEVISSLNHKWKVRTPRSKKWIKVTTWDIILTDKTYLVPKLNSDDVKVESIQNMGKHQVYCIGVEHKSECFLTEHNIVTGNCGKFAFKEIYLSALPSFKANYGSKLVPILSGTSGNADLSKDAKDVLSNPEAFRLLPMDWDRLERNVDPEYITWERSKKDKFCTFVPGQMSYRLETERKDTKLSTFLGIKSKELDLINVKETDWKGATEQLKKELALFDKIEDIEKQRMYYPLEIADVFITSAHNPFPTSVIDKHVRLLEDTGKRNGRLVNLYKTNSLLRHEFSDKKLSDTSHKGGEADAPIQLFGELPSTPPEKYIFVSGLDDYKLDQSDTDSLGAFYIIKRRNLEPNTPCEVIQASYVARPYRHQDFHKEIETLIEGYNSLCMMEAVDVSFKGYLDMKRKTEQLLAPSISFSNSVKNGKTKLNTTYGIYPTGGNKHYMFNLLIDWCKEEHVLGIDEEGNKIIKYGVEFIEDIDLLKEMLSYRKGGNFDRITAFMHALTYATELDKNNVMPASLRKKVDYDPTYDMRNSSIRLQKYSNIQNKPSKVKLKRY